MNEDEYWMRQALLQAEQAYACGEVPVGCVIVRDGSLIASGHNVVISSADPSAHAEIVALRHAGSRIGNYRLVDASLYVTLEPCLMCVGALIHARVGRVVFGAREPKAGAVSSHSIVDHQSTNHRFDVVEGVLEGECGDRMRVFFSQRR